MQKNRRTRFMNFSINPLERYEDERGWVSEIYSGEIGAQLQNIHLGTMEPGAVRGNHIHGESREWIIFFEGPVEVRVQGESLKKESLLTEPSEIALPPGVAHGFRNPLDSGKTIHFVAYRDKKYDEDNPDADPVSLF